MDRCKEMTSLIKAFIRISITHSTPFITQPLLDLDMGVIYKITGKYDMMVKVSIPDLSALDKINEKIKRIHGVVSTDSEIVIKEICND